MALPGRRSRRQGGSGRRCRTCRCAQRRSQSSGTVGWVRCWARASGRGQAGHEAVHWVGAPVVVTSCVRVRACARAHTHTYTSTHTSTYTSARAHAQAQGHAHLQQGVVRLRRCQDVGELQAGAAGGAGCRGAAPIHRADVEGGRRYAKPETIWLRWVGGVGAGWGGREGEPQTSVHDRWQARVGKAGVRPIGGGIIFLAACDGIPLHLESWMGWVGSLIACRGGRSQVAAQCS